MLIINFHFFTPSLNPESFITRFGIFNICSMKKVLTIQRNTLIPPYTIRDFADFFRIDIYVFIHK